MPFNGRPGHRKIDDGHWRGLIGLSAATAVFEEFS
jgi:hypothetical protein